RELHIACHGLAQREPLATLSTAAVVPLRLASARLRRRRPIQPAVRPATRRRRRARRAGWAFDPGRLSRSRDSRPRALDRAPLQGPRLRPLEPATTGPLDAR